MLRQTQKRLTVPCLHGFIPGGRPSQRGMLYRPPHLNLYTRIHMISPAQQTEEELRILQFVRWPEQYAGLWFISVFCAVVTYLWSTNKPFAAAQNRNGTLCGGMNQHELWKRNNDMSQIFKYHRELIKETREQYVGPRPDVFAPPDVNGAPWLDRGGTHQ